MYSTEERQLTNNSWFILEHDARGDLPADLQEQDIFAARDCGWISQMTPFIRAFSAKNDLVLDPFAGLGTTLLAALLEDRNAAGIEIEPTRIEIITERLSRHQHEQKVALHLADARTTIRDLESTVDLCLTSIPYFAAARSFDSSKIEGQSYSSVDYQSYLAIINDVFANIRKWLKKDKHAIFMCENLHLEEGFIPLAWDIARLLQDHFVLCDERIICYQKAQLVEPSNSKDKQDYSRTNRSHEYALVCRNSKL